MEIKVYNKLVRDRIPEIIEASGKKPVTRIVTGKELKDALDDKLEEEVDEFCASYSAEEAADALEVMRAIAHNSGVAWERIEVMADEEGFEPTAMNGLALILKMLRGVVENVDYSWDDVEAERCRKRAERGGFENGIFLISVEG